MSASVLLNFLNELGKQIRCEIIIQEHKSHFISKICTKTLQFRHLKMHIFMEVNA